jgi:surface antigen
MPRLRPLIACVAAAALVLLSSGRTALAINEMFADDAPISRMTQDDLRIAGEALRKALDSGRDDEVHEWKNPKTTASGTIVPARAFERQGMRCRGVKLSTTAQGRTSSTEWNVCKTPAGWKVAEGR